MNKFDFEFANEKFIILLYSGILDSKSGLILNVSKSKTNGGRTPCLFFSLLKKSPKVKLLYSKLFAVIADEYILLKYLFSFASNISTNKEISIGNIFIYLLNLTPKFTVFLIILIKLFDFIHDINSNILLKSNQIFALSNSVFIPNKFLIEEKSCGLYL